MQAPGYKKQGNKTKSDRMYFQRNTHTRQHTHTGERVLKTHR